MVKLFVLVAVCSLVYGVDYKWETEPDFSASQEVYTKAFMISCGKVPPVLLGLSDSAEVEKWVVDFFPAMFEDFLSQQDHLKWINATIDDKPVGCLIIDLAEYPKELYFSELAVHPDYQRQGIGSGLIETVIREFPDAEKYTAITRKVYLDAIKFWHAVRFEDSSYMHPGYDPELYRGFERILK
ncbi:MAG: GNAT family N-acetyltransferase [Verrucomicrobia bacterium]|nr:GNAT family N-acetyltransferase [Verrucomicrobiota bacterium]